MGKIQFLKFSEGKTFYVMLLLTATLLLISQNKIVLVNSLPITDSDFNNADNTTSFISKDSKIKNVTYDIRSESSEFETAHKIQYVAPKDNGMTEATVSGFHTAHIIATKERPELNPVLSAVINEDVMRVIIESKRAIKGEELAKIQAENEAAAAITETTETPLTILTTTTSKTPSPVTFDTFNDDFDAATDLDFPIEAAGSEQNRNSRIQVKKGPNGVDYEYEYVYYYYDDEHPGDDKAHPKKKSSSSGLATELQNIENSQAARGKSRYTNIERSTPDPSNEIDFMNSRQQKSTSGRAQIPVVEVIDEGRLPINTRFPPRSKSLNEGSNSAARTATTIAVAGAAATTTQSAVEGREISQQSKRTSLRRPSLELVDNDTFNTDEKQVKTNRNLAAEQAAAVKQQEDDALFSTTTTTTEENSPLIAAAADNSIDESTTPLMEKVAFDLYAILANENLNSMEKLTTIDPMVTLFEDGDQTTTVELDGAVTTDVTNAAVDDERQQQTENFQSGDTAVSSTTAAPRATTKTTTTATTELTATTTTTTAASQSDGFLSGQKRPVGAPGRNRFRLKPLGADTAPASPSTSSSDNSSPSSHSSSSDSIGKLKPKNRFQRPQYGGNRKTSTSPTPSTDDIVLRSQEDVKLSALPGGGTSPLRGRTRNRFNLRAQTGTVTDSSNDSGVSVSKSSVTTTTTQRPRSRPAFSIRSRSRTTPAIPSTTENDNESGNNNNGYEKSTTAAVDSSKVRPSRFNLNRPSNHQRPSLTAVTKLKPAASKPSDGSGESATSNDDTSGEQSVSDNTTTNERKENSIAPIAVNSGSLNRLRQRPAVGNRIQIGKSPPTTQSNTGSSKSTTSALVPSAPVLSSRKPNPLLANRRRLPGLGGGNLSSVSGLSTSTTTAGIISSADSGIENSDDTEETTGTGGESILTNTEAQQTAVTPSEQPRGLGLLGNRRRLPLRKPGTIL